MITPDELAERIGASWATFLERDRQTATPRPYVFASAWRACDRRMTYDATHADQAPPWPPEVLARFRRGDDRERDLLADLARIGRDADPPFKVHAQQQRFELRDRRGRVAIVGKIDARIAVEGEPYAPPVEVKSWSPLVVDRLRVFPDLFDHPWTASGAYQMLSYLFGAGAPFGFLLLDRSGLPRLLPVELDHHLDRMEAFLTRAESVVSHIAAGTLPEPIDDPAECARCPWYGAPCQPPETSPGPHVLTDPELEAALVRRESLQAAAREFDELDGAVKKALRGVEHGIAGPFEIRGKWGKSSRVELPADLKQRYTVTDPRGRFTLEIRRV